MSFTYAQLRDEYARLWSTMSVRVERAATVDSIARKSIGNKHRYAIVSVKTGVPWQFIAATHSMESGQNFGTHLHNGDPLTARTVQVPAGRPKTGNPPFGWDESAIDALTMPPHSLHEVKDWPIERLLYELERYNGWGYRLYHPKTLSPYLWSFTSHYTSGKYIADGKWSDAHASTQCGAAAILKRVFELEGQTPKVAPAQAAPNDEAAKQLQDALNKLGLADPLLKVDGQIGPLTKKAAAKVATL